jgi:transcription initiation factor TFIID TATA-box-binding protein
MAKSTIKIENVVASTFVNQKIDLVSFASRVEDAEYNKERFPGVVYRTKDPKVAALIFGSGKIVCTGAKSIEDVKAGIGKVFDRMQSLGIKVPQNPEIKIQNIVASANLGSDQMDLDAIAAALGLENVEYEPEMFPGLVYRLDSPKVVTLLFGSGKVVIAGGKSKEDVALALDKVTKELDNAGLL